MPIKFAEKAFWGPWKTYLKVMWSSGYFDKEEKKKQRLCFIIYEDTFQSPNKKQKYDTSLREITPKILHNYVNLIYDHAGTIINGEIDYLVEVIGRKLTYQLRK